MRAWAALVAICLSTALSAQERPFFHTDVRERAAKTALMKAAFDDVAAYFVTRHGLSLSHPIVFLGSDEPGGMETLLADALARHDRRLRRNPLDSKALCDGKRLGAAANREYIVMCWRPQDSYANGWDSGFEPRFTSVLAHEMTHHLQYQLARDRPARRMADNSDWLLGPSWLVEGMAELVETDYLTPLSAFGGKEIFDYQTRARRSRLILSDLQESGSVRGAAAYGVARFASLMLARKHGMETLFRYFEELGRLQDRAAAFEAAFGQSLASFDAEFEALRRDFGAARDYGRK